MDTCKTILNIFLAGTKAYKKNIKILCFNVAVTSWKFRHYLYSNLAWENKLSDFKSSYESQTL